MNRINKKHLLYWGNIIFLALNTAIFVSLYFNRGESVRQAEIDNTISNDFLRKELGFTEEQYNLITEMDSLVQLRYQKVLHLLCRERYKMLNELAKPEPSVEELGRIATSIGRLHRAMKIQTIHHLLNIKKVCNPEQLEKLDNIFMELLEINKYCKHCPRKCSAQEKSERMSGSNSHSTDDQELSITLE